MKPCRLILVLAAVMLIASASQARSEIASVDTLKNQGFNPNCIVLLHDKGNQ